MQDENRLMLPLQLAGRLIMDNGGATYRVEETITRMGHAFGLQEVDSFAVPSGVFITYRKSDGTLETAICRVHKGSTNLRRVDEVNAVSRLVESDHLSCDETLRRLEAIAKKPPLVARLPLTVAMALSCGGWAVMFGGGLWEFIWATLVGGLVHSMTLVLEKWHMQSLVLTLLGSFLASLLPMFLCFLTGLGTSETIVPGTLMPMLPGLAMTNAVQDTMRGDMISGLSHGISAILTAVLVAGGALLASSLFALLTGGAVL